MFVYSMKASTIKFFGVVTLSVIAMITLLMFIPTYEPATASSANSSSSINYSKIKTNEDRIAFISQFGWTVKENPVEEQELTIPAEFDNVFCSYNELQKQQGLDLSKYKRKTMTRYTYEITNYPDYDGTVYVNIIVYRNKVVGGDICTSDVNGFVKTFDGGGILP